MSEHDYSLVIKAFTWEAEDVNSNPPLIQAERAEQLVARMLTWEEERLGSSPYSRVGIQAFISHIPDRSSNHWAKAYKGANIHTRFSGLKKFPPSSQN